MGKLYLVKDRFGEKITSITHHIDWAPYFQGIVSKYKMDYIYGKDNSTLLMEKLVSEQDKLIISIFLNDRNVFTTKDILTFECCINEYPAHAPAGPRNVLLKYCQLLIRHDEIHTEYAGVITQKKRKP